MSHSANKAPYQQFYTKRLNTQLFKAPTLKDEFTLLTKKIEQQIQVVKRNIRTKNAKMFKAKEKRKAIENEQQNMRNTLRTKIESKIRLSVSNLEKIMVQRSSQSKSKQKFRETTLSRIKSMEKTFINESFKKSQQNSKNMETFFNQKLSEANVSINTIYSNNDSKTKYIQESSTKYETFSVNKSSKKQLPKILVTSDSQIKSKQYRKTSLQKMKEVKNLESYIEKLQDIDLKRKVRQNKIAETVKILEKTREAEKKSIENRRATQSFNQIGSKKSDTQELIKGIKSAIRNRESFSQIYSRKLEQKLTKKSYLNEMSMRQGDKIIAEAEKQKKEKRNNYLLKQSLKEMQLKANFRYMQRLKRK